VEDSLPFVSVIVPVYGDELLPICLRSLISQDYPAGRYEVVVVFNDHDDHQPPLTSDIVRYAYQSKPGSYAARNLGIQLTKGDVLAFTDVDCVADPAWLRWGVQALLHSPSIGFVGGGVERPPPQGRRPSAAHQYDSIIHLNQKKYVTERHFAATANMFTTRAMFLRVGPFNEDLMSGGDADWGQRAHQMGLEGRYEPKASVVHKSRSLWELYRKCRRLAGGKVKRGPLPSPHDRSFTLITGLMFDFKDEAERLRRRKLALVRAQAAMGLREIIALRAISLSMFLVACLERCRIRVGGAALRV